MADLVPIPRDDVRAALRGLLAHGGEMVRRNGRWYCGHCGCEFADADDDLVSSMVAGGCVVVLGRLSSGTPYHVELRRAFRA